MIATLVLIQLVVPLALIAAHALLPSASLAGLLLRTAAIGLAIGLVALGGVWLFPPWWAPYALVLGAVGNSGNSDEPHLHIHVQRGMTAEAPMLGEPVPLTLEGRFPLRNDRFSR